MNTEVETPPVAAHATLELATLLAAVLCPLLLFATYVPEGLAFGDGPELLTAVALGGIAHPSGYPLYLLLGRLALLMPGLSDAWNLGFYLSAVPAALGSGLIFATLRRLKVDVVLSLAIGLLFAGSLPVLAAATRIEVYALHALLTAATWYGLVGFELDRTGRWAALAWAAQCLALTNHLLSVFMLVPVAVVLITRGRGKLGGLRAAGWAVAIAGGAGALYALLPITAMTVEPGTAFVWNSPDTLERFLFHVTGAEYMRFRQDSDLLANLWVLVRAPSTHFFPGITALAAAGAVILVRDKRAPLAVAAGVLAATLLLYDASYQIMDIALYLIPLYVVFVLLLGAALDPVLTGVGRRLGRLGVQTVTGVMVLAAAFNLVAGNTGERYRDLLAEPMSQDVLAVAAQGSIVLTEADYQTFPLWVRAYVDHPESGLAIVNWAMFERTEMKWYRDFLRARHPEMVWPTEDALGAGTLGGFIGANQPARKVYALLTKPWQVEGYAAINLGWLDEIVAASELSEGAGVRLGRHAYMARFPEGDRQRTHLSESGRAFWIADRPLVCVAELLEGHGEVEVQTVFRPLEPRGEVVARQPVTVGERQTQLTQAFPASAQRPGVWVCEVLIAGRRELQAVFELRP